MARIIDKSEELAAIREGDVVWQEFRKVLTHDHHVPVTFAEPILSPLVMYHGILGNYEYYLLPDEMDAADYIRMIVRVWDVKPTDKERSETPWPTKEECQLYW